MTWIIIANTNQCHIYDHKAAKLTLLRTISHPENKLKSSELGTDRPGHYQVSTTRRGAYSWVHELHEIKISDFAREVAQELNSAQHKNQFSRLVLIMSAQIEGQILPHLDKDVSSKISQTIQKNIMHLPEHELLAFLNEQSQGAPLAIKR